MLYALFQRPLLLWRSLNSGVESHCSEWKWWKGVHCDVSSRVEEVDQYKCRVAAGDFCRIRLEKVQSIVEILVLWFEFNF